MWEFDGLDDQIFANGVVLCPFSSPTLSCSRYRLTLAYPVYMTDARYRNAPGGLDRIAKYKLM